MRRFFAYLKNNKRVAVLIALVLGVFSVGTATYLFFPSSAKGFFQNGTAILVKSWGDVFGTPREEYISPDLKVMAASRTLSSPVFTETDPPPTPVVIVEQATASSSSEKPKKQNVTVQENKKVAEKNSPPSNTLVESIVSSSTIKTVSENIPSPSCNTSTTATPSQKIILNEIAWMGSPTAIGEAASKASSREWLELKNISAATVRLSGWQVLNSSGNLKVIFDEMDSISAHGFYLLRRGDDTVTQPKADKIYSGTTSNAGDKLFVFDGDCVLSDSIDAATGWPAGNNTTKQTLERDTQDFHWHTSVSPGGTPRTENSILPEYLVTVSTLGEGTGTVSSSPSGILCGFDCVKSYLLGTSLVFSANSSPDSKFVGWSGSCSGAGKCSFTVTSSAAVAATFDLISPPPISQPIPSSTSTTSTPTSTDEQAANSSSTDTVVDSGPQTSATSTDDVATSTPTSSVALVSHLVIAAVQIVGASTTNDFVKIFNPTTSSVDLGGWKLRKKTSSGSDSSLREFAGGSSVASGGYFIWANSAGGFGDSISANVTSTATLAADNSIALFDVAGTIVDEVAWGTGTNQYVEGSSYPTSPTANQILGRNFLDGVIVDTDSNANDFTIQ